MAPNRRGHTFASGELERHPEICDEQHKTLLQSALEIRELRRIVKLGEHADPQRPGHIVDPWISNGSNQAVSADQVQRLAGQSRIGQFPNRAGVSSAVADAALVYICRWSLIVSLRTAKYRKCLILRFI
jgi:hypothetical protein